MKRPIGKLGVGEDNINTSLRKIACNDLDWIHLAQ